MALAAHAGLLTTRVKVGLAAVFLVVVPVFFSSAVSAIAPLAEPYPHRNLAARGHQSPFSRSHPPLGRLNHWLYLDLASRFDLLGLVAIGPPVALTHRSDRLSLSPVFPRSGTGTHR